MVEGAGLVDDVEQISARDSGDGLGLLGGEAHDLPEVDCLESGPRQLAEGPIDGDPGEPVTPAEFAEEDFVDLGRGRGRGDHTSIGSCAVPPEGQDDSADGLADLVAAADRDLLMVPDGFENLALVG